MHEASRSCIYLLLCRCRSQRAALYANEGQWSVERIPRLRNRPRSESEVSDSGFDAADAPRAAGKPLGNAALAGTFLPVNERNPQQNLTIQTSTLHEGVVQITFLRDSDHGRRVSLRLYVTLSLFTNTFDMNLFCFPQLATVIALGDGATFLLNLEQRTVGVFAVGRPVPLNARFAAWRN